MICGAPKARSCDVRCRCMREGRGPSIGRQLKNPHHTLQPRDDLHRSSTKAQSSEPRIPPDCAQQYIILYPSSERVVSGRRFVVKAVQVRTILCPNARACAQRMCTDTLSNTIAHTHSLRAGPSNDSVMYREIGRAPHEERCALFKAQSGEIAQPSNASSVAATENGVLSTRFTFMNTKPHFCPIG